MLNLTLNQAIYGVFAFSTSLALGSSLVNKNLLTVAGTLGICASGSAVLYSKDKKLLEQQEQANALFLKNRQYADEKYSELKLDLTHQLGDELHQVQESIQVLTDSSKEDKQEIEKELKRQQKRLLFKYNQTQRRVRSECDKLKHEVAKVKGITDQHTDELKVQAAKSKQAKPFLVKVKTKRKELSSVPKPPRPPKTAVFIDQSNFYHSCESLGIKPDYASLMCMLTPELGNCEIRIYLGVFDPPTRKQRELSKELRGLGYQVIELPIAVYHDGSKKVVSDDVRLSSDLQEMVSNGEITDRDRVVLVSGDGDFRSVLQKVRQQGIKVDLVAHKPSHYIKPLVNHITHLNNIKYDICALQKV